MTYDSWLALDVECSAFYNIMLIHALAASLCRERKQEMQSGVQWSSFFRTYSFRCVAGIAATAVAWLGRCKCAQWMKLSSFYFSFYPHLLSDPNTTYIHSLLLFPIYICCSFLPWMSVLACIIRQTGPWSMCLCFLSTSSSFLTSAHLPNSLFLLRARWFGKKTAAILKYIIFSTLGTVANSLCCDLFVSPQCNAYYIYFMLSIQMCSGILLYLFCSLFTIILHIRIEEKTHLNWMRLKGAPHAIVASSQQQRQHQHIVHVVGDKATCCSFSLSTK